MRKFVYAAAAAAALATASVASAAPVVVTPNTVVHPIPTETLDFFTSGNIFSGPITATFGDTGIPSGSFTDVFSFIIPQTGTGSGSLSTTTDLYTGPTDLDIASVIVNGLAATPVFRDITGAICPVRGVGTCGATETFAITSVPITTGATNTITVTGMSRGNGSYGGNATFTPAVPEPATWAMMLLGFAGMGMVLRRRGKPVLAQLA